MQEEPSREQLLLDVQRLSTQLENLKREKADLEILLETNTEHSDTMEAHLLVKAELAVRESEQQFRAIASATPVPVLVSRLSDGLILYANAQSASLLNIPLEELIGHHTPDFYLNPGDRPHILDALAKDGYLQDYELLQKVRRHPFLGNDFGSAVAVPRSADGLVRLVRPHPAQASRTNSPRKRKATPPPESGFVAARPAEDSQHWCADCGTSRNY